MPYAAATAAAAAQAAMKAGAVRIPATSTTATSTTCAIAQTRSLAKADRPCRRLKKALRHASCTIRPGMPMPSTISEGRRAPLKRNATATQTTPASTPSTSATPVAAAVPSRHSGSPVAL